MARRSGTKGKVCIRRKRTRAGLRCAKFGSKSGGTKRRRKSSSRKGRCLKWAKKGRGKRRCLRRAR